MSLSRDGAREIVSHIKTSSASLFGQKFWECRFVCSTQLVVKADKYESRFLVICKFRLFFVQGKNPATLKVDKGFNLLALRSLQLTPSELTLGWEDRSKLITVTLRSDDADVMDIAREILTALKHYFPDIGLSLPKFMSVVPERLLAEFPSLPSSTPDLPCHNFRRSYVALCDYFDHPFRDEIVWDVERIYFPHNIREIRLEDFNHLTVKDHVAVLGCAQFSSYFDGILVDGMKLAPEHIDVILAVVRRSHALKTLRLVNCGLPKDFIAQLALAIQSNVSLPLVTLDLSMNNFDDKKAFASLASVLPRLDTLKEIILCDCGLSEKSIHYLASGLYTGLSIDNAVGNKFELNTLSLARNVLKDDINELVNFVSLCTSLRVLDLSNTGVHVDRLWSALKLGGLQLEELLLSGCHSSKKGRESGQLVKELFSCMVKLKRLDISRAPLGAEILQSILAGLASNSQISGLNLVLDGVCDKGSAAVLEQFLPDCPLSSLSLRDNGLEQDAIKLFAALRSLEQLTLLDIGGSNFTALRSNKKYSSTLSKALTELVKLISAENCSIRELILSDCKLGSSLSVLFNALGVTSIEVLDVSNNDIGNFGARLLSKALQLNTRLKTLLFDRNQVSAEGYGDIARALELNQSITAISYPAVDISEALARPDRARVLSSWERIEKHLDRNRHQPDRSSLSCQKVLHSLNNNSDRYGVNNSDEKKIFFHALSRVIAEHAEHPIRSSRITGLVENILSQMRQISLEQGDELLSRIKTALAGNNVDVNFSSASHGTSSDEDAVFKKKVCSLLLEHLTNSVWNNALEASDALLTSSKGFELKGPLSNTVIDRSVHAQLPRSFRPNSTVLDNPGLISPLGDNSANEGHAEPMSSPLVHLAKSRPRPARAQKPTQRTLHQDLATSGDALDIMTASMHSASTADGSPRHRSASGDPMAEPQAAPPSPTIIVPSSTPPPLVPRRNKVAGVPPKLPPKPESPAKSPTDLRNHRTLVLPALGHHTPRDSDTDSL